MTLIKSISGIRGTIGGPVGENLTPIDVVKFTTAYVRLIAERNPGKKLVIVIGRDARISGDTVTRCKPDPEIYLTAAAALGMAPADCVVFEDAKAGIESARRAGVGRVVALATTLPREVLERETDADVIGETFADLPGLDRLLAD